jgi:hypothetical protein
VRVFILGCGPRALEHPPGAEVWVVNGPRLPKVWHRLFQLHGRDHIEHKHPGFVEVLQKIEAPLRLHMTRTYEDIPAAERFPIEIVKAHAGAYLTNSFALLIAFAVLQGASEIVLDGVMWSGGSAQWGAGEGWAVPCIEYHIGHARALGVKVTVPPGCGLFAHGDFVYGFEGPGSV